ncbi:loricrin, putative [Trichomonas vaginalis G3]|uniref:receptor protein-tyrosine kinase n=1 Tax=Trichomonas vaginalis (strain ATCC PRA-98 / G3) TaxID=412133 RepID=A2DVX8_TRIV3|nr:protein kinase a regulatory subunit binding [Trichomonas vaginalis G3]EAY15423.1 loricrin, putative [Trichomonas vaginalis G3]KAI5499614.1 protein kinase a regulatory subunit binding [Trichomonas vaginalis G3]|eukprot:XP_001327646.1 loricrin [Trichomonas vaginalis G3]
MAVYHFSFTGTTQSQTLPQGRYKFEVWGAQGGGIDTSHNSQSGEGGKGGYSIGFINFTASTKVFVNVGGVGQYNINGKALGGFNGSRCAWENDVGEPAHGGGGGTDIRINQNELLARVIVAGGGGGGAEDPGRHGGCGGGITGRGNTSGDKYYGTQNSSSSGGGFFQGAHTPYEGGGGGGGWYGGGTIAGSQTEPTTKYVGDTRGGSGGSGYVYTSFSAVFYPSGCLLNSSYFLDNAITISGGEQVTEPEGVVGIGHSGNGYARITSISIDKVGKCLTIQVDYHRYVFIPLLIAFIEIFSVIQH